MYTPKVEEHSSSRLSETWHLRHAVSIDNISFISCASNDDQSSTNKDNISVIDHHHQNNRNYDLSKNSSMENLNKNHDVKAMYGSPPPTPSINGTNNGLSNNRNSNRVDEQENIIPWRAQLRKTNSRLSLVG